jgi:hypothetical protein
VERATPLAPPSEKLESVSVEELSSTIPEGKMEEFVKALMELDNE